MQIFTLFLLLLSAFAAPQKAGYVLTHEQLRDKIKGAWAGQTIGVTYGGPTEFRYLQRTIADTVALTWTDTTLRHWMTQVPGLYDDIYMDLTFVEVFEREGLDAPVSSFAKAYAEAGYWLWHANQQGRYNILNGIDPPASGHWLHNPHADDIDFQIEADFAGIMNPGMPNSAAAVCDRIGHIMNAGDGYYGGLFIAAMYSYAFVEKDIPTIIRKALAHIPKESTFYRCIADVVRWHRQYPADWRQTWREIENAWGEDIGCPDGAGQPFNIDAKMNSAYVVLGLLYGEGDFGKTLDITTRAGQDSDCNPASSGAIVATVKGYSKIPEKWKRGLALIEDMDFPHTHTSLKEAYELSYRQALEMIRRNGGKTEGRKLHIPRQEVQVAPLEQNFPGYKLKESIPVHQRFEQAAEQEWRQDFEGVGLVVRGKLRNLDFENHYALITPEETRNNAMAVVDFLIDGKTAKSMKLPLWFIQRSEELFFQYELPPGKHQLSMRIRELPERMILEVRDVLVYGK